MADMTSDLRTQLKFLRAKQLALLPRPAKPTTREKRQYVQEKLHGFELRQAAREKKRKDLIEVREARDRQRQWRKRA